MITLNDHRDTTKEPIQIAGAGPGGLAAAITLARADRRVVIHEAQRKVGYRFQRDLQGLENWTTEQDVLEALEGLGIMTTGFARLPCRHGIVFDAWGRAYEVVSEAPLFYMVERGPGPLSLDTGLLVQAQACGVEVRFNSRLDRLEGPGILAAGPKTMDAIAVGYHFDTAMENGFWAICDDNLAPQGYAYLLVMNGRGTVKTCLFSGFKDKRQYIQRTLEAFRRLVGLEMIHPRPHGGVGHFCIPISAYSGIHPLVREQAGFQDMLWGVGMRWAILSGVLAARSLLEGSDYDALWRRELGPWLQAAVVNRRLYDLLGNRGYRWVLRCYVAQQRNARRFLHRAYRPSWRKRWIARALQTCRY